MTDDLFKSNDFTNDDPSSDPFSSPSISFDDSKDYLSELVGDDKKFKDYAALAKGKAHSDAYIAHLLREMKEVKEELNKRRTLEEFMTQIESKPNGMQAPSNVGTPQPQEPNAPAALNLEDIKRQVREELEAKSREEARMRNLNQVTAEMNKLYGDQAASVIQTRAKELGLPLKQLQDLAADTPAAFFRLIGEPAKTPTAPNNMFSPPNSSVNTTATPNNKNTGDRTYSYYQKLKQANPREYESSKVQVQMHKDAMRLGERFFDV